MIGSVTVFFSLFLMLAAAGRAQIIITKTDVESGFLNSKRTSYNHAYMFMSYPSINLYSSSASAQNFDFSTMAVADFRDTIVQDFVAPGALPGASDFPAATVGSMSASEPFPGASIVFVEFMSIENDGVYGLGNYIHQVFPPVLDTVIVTKYMPKRMFFPLPMTYGTTKTFRDTSINDASTGEYEVTTRSFIVNGFGSITFPPAGSAPGLSKTAGGEQCLRVITDDLITAYDGSDNLIATGHNWGVKFVGASSTTLSVSLVDTNYISGSTDVSGRSLSFKSGSTSVTPVPPGVPENFSLSQNYPNPFNPATKITFAVPTESFVSLKVFDILGRELATLASSEMNAGTYTVDFDAAHLSGGLYFYRLTAGSSSATMKMSLVK